MVTKLGKTLAQREKDYGYFVTTAETAQRLKYTVDCFDENLSSLHREALDLIMTKIARILCGNPNHKDSWHDIAGYATIVEESIKNG